jgi:inorganic pyrophosphatase
MQASATITATLPPVFPPFSGVLSPAAIALKPTTGQPYDPAHLAPHNYSMLHQGAIAASNPYFNYVNQIPLHNADGTFNAFVEIPAGQRLKVEYTNAQFMVDEKFGEPRQIQYLPYVANYGEFPRSLAKDGDPVDVLILNGAMPPGTIKAVKVLGALNMIDGDEQDAKVIAVDPDSPFWRANSLEELEAMGPGVLAILKLWFENYKTESPGKVKVNGFLNREETLAMLEEAHQAWAELQAV